VAVCATTILAQWQHYEVRQRPGKLAREQCDGGRAHAMAV